MRPHRFELVLFSIWLAAAAFLSSSCARPAFAQQDEDDEEGIGIPPELRRDLFPPDSGKAKEANRIYVPRSRELDLALRRADALAEKGEWNEAARTYLEILAAERDPASGRQRVSPVGPQGPSRPSPSGELGSGRHVSYLRLVRERLYALPEEGRKAFRALADEEARARYEAACREGSVRDLEIVWRSWPIASAAGPALERLGDLALEAGEGPLARDRYERAAALSGAEAFRARLARKIEAARALERAAEAAAASIAPAHWPVVGGRNDHASPLPILPAIGEAPRFEKPLPPSRSGREWAISRARPLRRFEGQPPFRGPAFADVIPVAAGGHLVVVTERAISCYSIETGERHWYQTPWTGKEYEKSANLFYSATIAKGRVFASFIDRISAARYYRGIPIVEDIPHRRLLAFDLESGKRLWDLADSQDPFLRAASFALPPIERHGVLYAGATVRDASIKTYLVALDAASGKLIWKRFLGAGQIELTMFGEQAIEPLAMMPAERAGTIYHCTAFGVIAAVSALTGEVEWLQTYDTIALEAAQTYYARERQLVWRNVPPLVAEGTLVVAPLDSEKVYALDAESGEIRWALDHGSDRRVLGAAGGRVILQGDRLRAIDLRSGKLLWSFPADGFPGASMAEEEAGEGLLAGGEALVPLTSRILRVDLAQGRPGAGRDVIFPNGGRDGGSLLFVAGTLVTANPQKLSAFPLAAPEGAGQEFLPGRPK